MTKLLIVLLFLPLLFFGVHFFLDIKLYEGGSIDLTMLFINYFLLVVINSVAILLTLANFKLKMMNFAGLFIVFTTIQMLASMSYALFIVQTKSEPKIILIHFLIGFFVNLLFQSIILNKAQQRGV